MKKLIAYITTCPDINFTTDLILSLKESVDKIELGIPFSDPVADGEVIQKVNKNSLDNGFKLNDTFLVSKNVSNEIETYWMGYFNNFYHKGYDFMVEKAKEFNIKGFIIPDLPFEEAIEYEEKFPLISFVAPTDSKERIQTILKNPKEFIYLVAYAGITGANKKEDLSEVVKTIKEITDIPVYIGFGVNENTAKEKSKDVDGVIVGSEFVKVLLEDISKSEKIKKISQKAKIIKDLIND